MGAKQDLANYQFKADLAKFQKIVRLNIRDLVRRLVLELWNKIIEHTPVDTGTARRGWGVVFDSLEVTVPPKGSYGPPPMPAQIHLIDGNQTVAIINAVEYIEALEFGHSARKPEGMVRISLEEVAANINAFIAASGTP